MRFASTQRHRSRSGSPSLSWTLLLLTGHELAFGLLCLAGIAVGAILTAFCVQHDANHGAYFSRRRYNHLLGWTSDSLLGISSYAWRVKHNVAHHTYTNVDVYDDDVTQVPFARLSPTQAHAPLVPLPALLHLADVRRDGASLADVRRRRRIRARSRRTQCPPLPERLESRRTHRREGDLRDLGHRRAAPASTRGGWSCWPTVAFTMITSVVMAVTFQLAHCVEEAEFASAEELSAEKRVWAVHEVETTVNFCARNRFLTWVLGGLNYQIEHHLFPTRPAHALSRDRTDRAPELPEARHPLQRSSIARTRAALALPCTCVGWGDSGCRCTSRWGRPK